MFSTKPTGPAVAQRSDDPIDADNIHKSVPVAATNYGSQVTYNYGSISNYFCHNPHTHHQHEAPVIDTRGGSKKTRLLDKIQKARSLYQAQKWMEAKILFYDVSYTRDATPPEVAETILIKYNLAHAHFNLKEYDEAATHFEHVADVRDENTSLFDKGVGDSRYWLARAFFHQNNYENAAWHLEIFIQALSEHDYDEEQQAITGRLWLGRTLDKLMLYDRARDQLQAAYEMSRRSRGPQHLETLACRHHLANFLFKQKALKEAYEHFQQLLEAEEALAGPEKSQAIKTRLMLAWSLARLQQFGEAEPHFQRVLDRLSLHPRLLETEGKDFGLVCYWVARIRMDRSLRRRQLADTRELLQRATIYLVRDPDLSEELIDCRSRLAQIMTREGHAAGAEQVFRSIVNTSTIDVETTITNRLGLADALLSQGKLEEAQSCLQESIDIDRLPTDTTLRTGKFLDAVLLLGRTHVKLKQPSHAQKCFEYVVEPEIAASDLENESRSQTRRADAHFGLGKLHFWSRSFEDARVHLQQAQILDLQLASAYEAESKTWLAWTLCELRLFEDAASKIFDSLTFMPGISEKPTPYSNFMIGHNDYYRACISLHRKLRKQALAAYESALPRLQRCEGSSRCTYIKCLFHFAFALHQLTRYDEAQVKYQEILRTPSESEDLRRIRDLLTPFWLGDTYIARHDFVRAKPLIEQCLQSLAQGSTLSNDRFGLHDVQFSYASCLAGTLDFDRSKEILQDLLSLTTFESELYDIKRASHKLLAKILFYTNHLADAYEHCRAYCAMVQEKDSRHQEINQFRIHEIILAVCLCEKGQVAEAEPLLARAATTSKPTSALHGNLQGLASCWLGRIAFEKDRKAQAERYFENAQNAITKTYRDRYKIFDRTLYICRFFLARAQIRRKDYGVAANLLEDIVPLQTSAGFLRDAVDSRYWLARSHQYLKDYSIARPLFQRIIDDKIEAQMLKDTWAKCYYQLGYASCKEKDYEQAKTQLQLSIDHTREDPASEYMAHYWLAHAYLSIELFEEAKKELEIAIAKDECQVWRLSCRYWLGISNFRMGKFEEAVPDIQFVHDTCGNAWYHRRSCHIHLARAHFELCHYDVAKDHFVQICEELKSDQNPMSVTSVDCQVYLGRCLLEINVYDEAEKVFSSIVASLKHRNNTSKFILKSAEFYLACCHIAMGLSEQAKTELQSLVPFFDERPAENLQVSVQVHYKLGIVAHGQRRYKSAIDSYKKSLQYLVSIENAQDRMLDVHQDCHARIGRCFYRLGKYEEAQPALRQALAIHEFRNVSPDKITAQVMNDLARTLCRLKKFGAALPHAIDALHWQQKLNGKSSHTCLIVSFTLGQIAYGLSDYKQAEELYLECLFRFETVGRYKNSVDSVFVVKAYAQRALMFAASGNAAEAQSMAEKAVQHDSTSELRHCRNISGFMERFLTVMKARVPSSAERKEPPEDSKRQNLPTVVPKKGRSTKEKTKSQGSPSDKTTSSSVVASSSSLPAAPTPSSVAAPSL